MRPRYQLIGLLLLTALVYQSVRTHPFVYEDENAIVQHAAVRMQEPVDVTRTRWLTVLTYRLTFWAVGEKPAAYHLTNLGLHLANGVLVYHLAVLYVAPQTAVLAAGLFLLHPLQGEAVNYAASRTDLLSTCLILSALLLAWRQTWRRSLSWTRALGVFLLGAAAMCAKESAIVVVPLLLIDPMARGWEGIRRYWKPLIGLLGMQSLAMITVLRHEYRFASDYSPLRFAAIESAAVWRYVGLTLWPRGFTVDHDFEVVPVLLAWLALGALVAVIGWAIWRRHTVIGFGVLWAAVCLAPRFALPLTEFLAEHQTYLAWIGIWLVLAMARGLVWA